MELSEYLLFIKARYYDCDLIHIYLLGLRNILHPLITIHKPVDSFRESVSIPDIFYRQHIFGRIDEQNYIWLKIFQ